MRKPTFYFLLALFLFTGKVMHGYAAEQHVPSLSAISLQQAVDHSSRDSLKQSDGIKLSFTSTVAGNTQYGGIKKVAGYATIQQLLSLDNRLTKTIRNDCTGDRILSPHLVLLFPFHYFW